MQVNFVRPRTGRETSRNNANQREPVINQNGRPEAVSGCLCRSAEQVGVPCQGEGRGFESRRPLHGNPLFSRGFFCFSWLETRVQGHLADRPHLTRSSPVYIFL